MWVRVVRHTVPCSSRFRPSCRDIWVLRFARECISHVHLMAYIRSLRVCMIELYLQLAIIRMSGRLKISHSYPRYDLSWIPCVALWNSYILCSCCSTKMGHLTTRTPFWMTIIRWTRISSLSMVYHTMPLHKSSSISRQAYRLEPQVRPSLLGIWNNWFVVLKHGLWRFASDAHGALERKAALGYDYDSKGESFEAVLSHDTLLTFLWRKMVFMMVRIFTGFSSIYLYI